MSYIKDGKKVYTLKEKKIYHEKLANTGHDLNGEKLTTAQRVRHGILAVECGRKQNRFQKTGQRYRDMHIKRCGKKEDCDSAF